MSKHWINGFGNIVNWSPGVGDAPFSPLSLPDLAFWLDAADLTPGTLTSWTDKSSNAHVLTNGIGTVTAVASVLNGKTVARFPGNACLRKVSTGPFTEDQEHTFFVVFKNTKTTGYGGIFCVAAETDAVGYGAVVSDQAAYGPLYWTHQDNITYRPRSSTSSPQPMGGAINTWLRATLTFNGTKGSASGYTCDINGSTGVQAAAGGGWGGRGYAVGVLSYSESTAYCFEGDIAEVIAYTRKLTSDEINDINDYLTVKWAL
jgi:hypothetical protein